MRSKLLVGFAAAVVSLCGCACHSTEQRHASQATTGGDADRGAQKIAYYGCGSCHIIPGISGASGLVGPPLSGIGNRIYIGGVLQNTPANMVRWIENPKAIDEKTVMPNLGVTHNDAIDIAGYLYTLQ